MKALSLWQPWASLVAHGIKTIETRPRAMHYRGPLAIHAAKRWDMELFCALAYGAVNKAAQQINQHLRGVRDAWNMDRVPEEFDLPLGAIIGTADVIDCKRAGELTIYEIGRKKGCQFSELDLGDFTIGRYGIILANARPLASPIVCPGRQGLWNVPEGIEMAIRNRVPACTG